MKIKKYTFQILRDGCTLTAAFIQIFKFVRQPQELKKKIRLRQLVKKTIIDYIFCFC